MEGGAIAFMGNTGFGLGDTASVAYSERLNQLFAARLNGTMTIGEALEYAKQEYFGDLGIVSLYDAKVGNEATFYGIPTYRLGTGTPPTAPTPAADAHGLGDGPDRAGLQRVADLHSQEPDARHDVPRQLLLRERPERPRHTGHEPAPDRAADVVRRDRAGDDRARHPRHEPRLA